MEEKITVRTEYIQKENGMFSERHYVGDTLVHESENEYWMYRRFSRPYFLMVPVGEWPWPPYDDSEIRDQVKMLELATMHRRVFQPTTALIKEGPKAIVLHVKAK